MDPEEERIQYLSRVGREKIFKHGTYTVVKERQITQDHPFYAIREPEPEAGPEPETVPAPYSVISPKGFASILWKDSKRAPEAAAEPDPAQLAGQILSSNFKVGLSQEEVDALLNGM